MLCYLMVPTVDIGDGTFTQIDYQFFTRYCLILSQVMLPGRSLCLLLLVSEGRWDLRGRWLVWILLSVHERCLLTGRLRGVLNGTYWFD